MSALETVDFTPGGVVRVRVADGRPADVAAVVRQLGEAQAAERDAAPQITIRFVDRLAETGPVRWIDLDDAAATDTDFLVLRGRLGSRTRVVMPLDQAGGPLEIVCERPVRAVPLLVPLINLAALGQGVVPVHGSAVQHDGRGILIVGWSKGGKTETVLSLMGRGAEFVGDEWIYLHPDGRGIGIGEPIRIWGWQVNQLPWLADAIGSRSRTSLRVTAGAAGAVRASRRVPGIRGSKLGSVLDRAEPIVRRQASVQVPPGQLFGERVRPETVIDAVILASSVADEGVSMTRVDSADLVERVVQSNHHERLNIITAAAKFRFAFPGRPTDAIDGASDIERSLLGRFFADRPAWRLDHPYPPMVERLADAIIPALEDLRPGR